MFRKMQSMLYRQFTVMANERALLFYRGRLIRIVRSGQVRVFDPFRKYSIEYFPLETKPVKGKLVPGAVLSKFRQRLVDLQYGQTLDSLPVRPQSRIRSTVKPQTQLNPQSALM